MHGCGIQNYKARMKCKETWMDCVLKL